MKNLVFQWKAKSEETRALRVSINVYECVWGSKYVRAAKWAFLNLFPNKVHIMPFSFAQYFTIVSLPFLLSQIRWNRWGDSRRKALWRAWSEHFHEVLILEALAALLDDLHGNSYTPSTHFSLSLWYRGFNTTVSVTYLRLWKKTLKITVSEGFINAF